MCQFKIGFAVCVLTIVGCSQPNLRPPNLLNKLQQQPQQIANPQEDVVTVPDSKAHSDGEGNRFQYPSTGVDQWTPYAPSTWEKQAIGPKADFALLDAGRALRAVGRNEEAITVLNMLLDGPNPNADRDWPDSTRHRACLELSEIHHDRAQVSSALRFAILARDKYPYSSFCGLEAMAQRQELEERIASLERELGVDQLRCR